MYVSKCLFAYFHNSLHSFTKSRGFPERFLLSAISFAYGCWELKNFPPHAPSSNPAFVDRDLGVFCGILRFMVNEKIPDGKTKI